MGASPLADELAIRNLVARYADAVGRRDEADWARTWADDGEWHVLGNAARGREECVALWRRLMGGLDFVVQLPASGFVSVAGDRATGRWWVTEHGKLGGGGFLSIGVYDDAYRRVGDDWRFAVRRFHGLYAGPPDMSGEPRPLPSPG
jgi:hypothetical protein